MQHFTPDTGERTMNVNTVYIPKNSNTLVNIFDLTPNNWLQHIIALCNENS